MCDCDAFVDIFLEQTALVGQVSEEFNLLPVENEELRRISEKAAIEAMKPKEKVQYIDDISPDITNAAILLPTNKGHFVVCFARGCWLHLQLLTTFPATKQIGQGQGPREQVYPYPAKRAVGSYFRVLQRIPLLAFQNSQGQA